MYNHEQEISDSDSEFSENELEVYFLQNYHNEYLIDSFLVNPEYPAQESDEESDPQNNLSVILAVDTIRNRRQSRGQPHGSRANRGGRSSQQISLPNPPKFIFLQHRLPFHERGYPILPGHLQQLGIVTPLMLFYENFLIESLRQIVESTNKY
ncbi:30780_t:CDS:1, partial [Racocetra persica]